MIRSILSSRKAKVFLILLAGLLMGAGNVEGATKTASVSGNWNSVITWGGSTVPNSNDDIIVNNGVVVSMNQNYTSNATFTINGSGEIHFSKNDSYTLTINGKIIFTGNSTNSITANTGGSTATAFILSNGATLVTSNSLGVSGANCSIQTAGAGFAVTLSTNANYEFNGAGQAQATNGLPATVNNLTISNADGVTLSNAVSVSGTLNLTSGNLSTTSTNLLSITNTSTSAIFGASSSSFINGPMKWNLPAGLRAGSTYNFPVGSGSTYLPFSLVNPTTTGISSAQVQAFAIGAGGSADGTTLTSVSTTEYWSLLTASNFTNSSVSLTRPATAIFPHDAIGGSTSKAGSYTLLDGTVGTYGITGSSAIGTSRYFVFAKKKPTLSIAATAQAAEGESHGEFTITSSSNFASATTVNITVSGTALNGTDYAKINSTITFPSNSSTVTIPVMVTNDLIYEGAETVTITLNAGPDYTIGTPSSATINISDDETPPIPSVSLSIDHTSIAENGGVATVTATLSNTSTQPVIIGLAYSGTASHPNDYQNPFYLITIAAGSLTGTAKIAAAEDCVVEEMETVMVDIESVTNGKENGTQQVTTTIIDDDVFPTITLAANNLSIPENGGTAIVTATLSNTFCQDVVIYLGYSGTANHPNDYPNPASYSVTITAGSLSGTVTITSSNDYLVEGNETVIVGVQSTNVAGISTTVNPVTITIVDDDSYSIIVTPTSGLVTAETGGSATFTVVLNAITYNDVTIQLTSSDLTEGTVFPSSIKFTNGNFFTPQTVTVTGVDDALADGNIDYIIITSAAVSDDNNFKGIEPSDVSVSNTDNEVVSKAVWYKADMGTSSLINGADVTSWTDQSGQSNNASSQNTAPTYQSLGWNFNPTINFSSGYYLSTSNGISDDLTFFAVYSSLQASGSSSFWNTPAIIGCETASVQNDYTLSTNAGKLYFKGTYGDGFGAQTTGNYNDGIVKIVSVTRQKSATGKIYLYVDGLQVADVSSDNISLSAPQKIGIGNHYSYVASAQFIGNISEVFGVQSLYSATDRQKFESYLALKYGVTLTHNYISSGGTTIYSISGYGTDIAGLGNDNTYGLNQKVSSSVNTPSGTSARVVMATDNDFISSNLSPRTSLSNGQYLIWGHNNLGVGNLTTDGDFDRVARIWKVENTGISSAVNFQIDLNGFPNPSELILILDDDANTAANGGTSVVSLTNSSGTLYSASVTFPEGTSYFLIGKCKPPTVSVNSPTICAGAGSANIMATPSPSGTYNYVWTVPSGADNPGNVASFDASVAGVYSVAITNSNGCTGNGSGTLTVNERPTISGLSTVCLDGTIELTGSGSAATNNAWTSDSPAIATVNSIGLVSGVSAGNCKIIYTDNNGCSTIKEITVNDLPQGSLTANGPFYTSGSGQLTWTATAGIGSYTIVYNDGTEDRTASNVTSGTSFPIYAVSVTNTTTYTLVSVTDANNCNRNSDFTEGSATITIISAVANNSIIGTQSFCGNGDPAQLIGSVPTGGTGAFTYQWQKSSDNLTWVDIAVANSQNYDPPAISSTTYYRRGVSSGTYMMDYSESIQITVNILPATFNVTGGGSFCSGSGVEVGLPDSETGVSYQLYKNGTSTGSPIAGTGLAISFGNQTAGAYTVKATNSTTSCTQDMASIVAVTDDDTEKPVISSFPANRTVACSTDLPVVKNIDEFEAAGGSVSDNCTPDPNLIFSASDVLDLNEGCKVTRTYTIADVSGNIATCKQVFTINDVAKPVITCNADLVSSPNTDDCAATLTITAPTAISENCSLVNISPTYSYRLGNDPSATPVTGTGNFTATFPEGNTTISWVITDLCGNTSTPCTQIIHVGFNLTDISYDNGSTEAGIGSGIQPIQTSTHEYFVDNKTPERDYKYTWGLFENNGGSLGAKVNSATITNINTAHIKITFTGIQAGNYILSVIKTKDGTACKNQTTRSVTVLKNTFDTELKPFGNQCQAGETGTPSTIIWEVTFSGGGVAPYSLHYKVNLIDESNNQTTACTGTISNITLTGTTLDLDHQSGCNTNNMPYMRIEKTATDSYKVLLKYTMSSITARNFTASIQIDASDKFSVSEIKNDNNSETLDLHGVPNTSEITTD